MSNLEDKLLHLKKYHEETFKHMQNVGKFMYLLSECIGDNDELKKFELYIQKQLFLDDKKDIYKFIGYMHDIGKADITDRMNRYSMINPKVDLAKYFIYAIDYIFKDKSQLSSDNMEDIDNDEYYKNIGIIEKNINSNEKLKNNLDKMIMKLEIISMDKKIIQKLFKEIILFSVNEYKNLSKNIENPKKIINDDNLDSIKTVRLNFSSRKETIEISKIKGLDFNTFLWNIIALIKIVLNKIIEKIQYPHIKEGFNFIKTNETFAILLSSFFHHTYPSMKELEESGIIDIIKNNYKNMGESTYLSKVQEMSLKNSLKESYPNEIKDPIAVMTTIIDIIEALIISKRSYQLDGKEIKKIESDIDKLNINKGLKKIMISGLAIENKDDFEKQYSFIVEKILDNMFGENNFYKQIRQTLLSKEFKEKLKI